MEKVCHRFAVEFFDKKEEPIPPFVNHTQHASLCGTRNSVTEKQRQIRNSFIQITAGAVIFDFHHQYKSALNQYESVYVNNLCTNFDLNFKKWLESILMKHKT